MYKIGVQVVVNNKLDLTIRFIENFLKYYGSNGNITLLIIDNNSSDNTFEFIKSNYKNVNIIKLNDNYGTTTGRNIGIVFLIEAGYDYLYLSDNDIEFRDEGFFDKLSEFQNKNAEIDASCPVVKWFDDESIQTLGTRELKRNWFKNITMPDNNIYINSLPGCAQYVKGSTFKKYGVFDNDLSPISIEDLEWGMRATHNGAKLAYVKHCEVYHMQQRNKKNSPEKMEHILKGRGVFMRKHFSLQCVAREIRNFIYSTLNYGFFFTIRSYKKGLIKKLNKNNYDYDKFKETVSKYIIDKYMPSI